MLPVSDLPLLSSQYVGVVEILDLPCLALGGNSNLASDDMADLWRQYIALSEDNDSSPQNISDRVPELE